RVTKIGKCRYCVRDRSRGNALPKLLLETDRASCITRERWSLGLQFRDDSLGHLLANARRARNHGYVAQCDGVSQFGRRKGRKNAKCNLRANALNIAHQQAEPFTLQRRAEPIEPNRILTHIGFDEERRCGSCTIQRSERARRTMHDIAHTIHIDDAVIVTDLIDKTLQLTNHAADSLARRHAGDCRWCAWQIAMAIASAASSVSKLAFG